MKKFRLVSSSFMDQDGVIRSRQQFVEAKSFADVIEYIESNAGWYIDNNAGWHTANNAAFKVAYIEEIVNETKKSRDNKCLRRRWNEN